MPVQEMTPTPVGTDLLLRGSVDSEAPTPEIQGLPESVQMVHDRFSAIREVTEALPKEDRLSDESFAVTNQLKWATEAIVDEILPQTHQFTSARRGFEVDVDQTAAIIDEVAGMRSNIKTKLPDGMANSVFEHVDQSIVNNAIELLVKSKIGSVGNRRREVPGLDEVIGITAKYLSENEMLASCNRFIQAIVNNGRQDILSQPAIADLLETPTWRKAIVYASLQPAVERATHEKARLTDEEKLPTLQIFGRYGFSKTEAEDILGASLAHKPKDVLAYSRATTVVKQTVETFKALDALTEVDPTLPKKVYELFGIRNFARYSTESLARQADPDYKPDTVALSAVADWNGAFNEWGEEIANFSPAPLYVEANNTPEILERFRTLRAANIPVSRVMVGAHGSRDSMTWGRMSDEYTHKEVIARDPNLQRLVERKLIQPDCQVVMFSCNTGHDGGIADELARLPGIGSVQAPNFAPEGIFADEFGGVEYGNESGQNKTGRIYTYPG